MVGEVRLAAPHAMKAAVRRVRRRRHVSLPIKKSQVGWHTSVMKTVLPIPLVPVITYTCWLGSGVENVSVTSAACCACGMICVGTFPNSVMQGVTPLCPKDV